MRTISIQKHVEDPAIKLSFADIYVHLYLPPGRAYLFKEAVSPHDTACTFRMH